MNSNFRPGLRFRIRDTTETRNLGLSPHGSHGWVTHIDDTYISMVITSGKIPEHEIKAKTTYENFQLHFTIDPFTAPDHEKVKGFGCERIFP
ncbi:MAG: hypothetical protein SH856_02205 [Flavobacteriales bacterium]|nr:hypothetical protein [Flavobacteriales bacterium]